MHPLQKKLVELNRVRKLSELTYREIARQLSENGPIHPFAVKYHIDLLVKADQLGVSDRPVSASPRKAAQKEPYLVRIPLMGSANAGRATIFADNDIKTYVNISSKILCSKNYPNLIALTVTGNSMNKAEIAGGRIENGDTIIVDRQKVTPRDNEIVITNHNDLVNIKRFRFDYENRMVTLKSDSTEDHEPIYLSADDNIDAFIEGTVTQVLKSSERLSPKPV